MTHSDTAGRDSFRDSFRDYFPPRSGRFEDKLSYPMDLGDVAGKQPAPEPEGTPEQPAA